MASAEDLEQFLASFTLPGLERDRMRAVLESVAEGLPPYLGDASLPAWRAVVEEADAYTRMHRDRITKGLRVSTIRLFDALVESGYTVLPEASRSLGSKSEYLRVQNPFSGRWIKIRLSDHEAAPRAVASNGAADIDVGIRQWRSALVRAKRILGPLRGADLA